MTLPETIAKLRALLADATPGPWSTEGHWVNAAADPDFFVMLRDGGSENDADLISEMRNALPQLIDALEARESEKPREWWTVGEKAPPHCQYVLKLDEDNEWAVTHYINGWCGFNGVRPAKPSDIWMPMPPVPVQ